MPYFDVIKSKKANDNTFVINMASEWGDTLSQKQCPEI